MLQHGSVADPGCLSRIRDPDFYPSRILDPGSLIPDPKTATKDRGEKKFFCETIFCSHKFHKTQYNFIFDMLRKKFGPIFQELLKFLPKPLSPSPHNYGFGIRDPRSGIRDPEKTIPDSGSRIQGSKRHRIPDPQHCFT
jgi:hypothetical protein